MFLESFLQASRLIFYALILNWNILKLHLLLSSSYVTFFCENKPFGRYSWTKQRLIS